MAQDVPAKQEQEIVREKKAETTAIRRRPERPKKQLELEQPIISFLDPRMLFPNPIDQTNSDFRTTSRYNLRSINQMEKKLLLICILTTLQTTHTIFSSVCDCNYVKTRGILDINSSYYCKNPSTTNQPRFLTNYTLKTKQNPVKTWKRWTCKQWMKTKKITGSFWIGSFDTVYSQETKLLSAIECWEMAGTTKLSFTSTPTEEGKWYAIKEYHALNYLAEEITLKQETSERLVESPFGFQNTTQQEGERDDHKNQVNIDTWSCNEYADPVASKGSIRMGHPIITNVEENGIMTKKDTIAYLMVNGSSINTQVSVHNQYDIQDPLPTGTKFEYIVDHSIRLINSNICIVATENNQIMAENCTENTSRWILDLTNDQWISLETGLCITLHDEEEGRVRLATLKTCSRQGAISESQQWVIEILTTNPDVLDNFPDASIDEFEEIQLEQRKSVTTTNFRRIIETEPWERKYHMGYDRMGTNETW
ncbi:hypothetical protein OUZ56_032292 [Daphnia magna]|uniref:Ricin B lectin domain-containing protein n=1 Tax=Daphnia magna TaxID=35525 RepID=A0ABQ9ZWQ3_9CRUS|nr:hypothetical protein OUZ56_032292 [Daphnia magna]